MSSDLVLITAVLITLLCLCLSFIRPSQFFSSGSLSLPKSSIHLSLLLLIPSTHFLPPLIYPITPFGASGHSSLGLVFVFTQWLQQVASASSKAMQLQTPACSTNCLALSGSPDWAGIFRKNPTACSQSSPVTELLLNRHQSNCDTAWLVFYLLGKGGSSGPAGCQKLDSSKKS